VTPRDPADTLPTPVPSRSRDEIALEMMKFIAMTTGYGKGTSAAGFTGKATRTAEEYTDALLQLFERCRSVLGKD
jgi:hypothetical protein